MKTLHADILAIGSELLHGGRVDSNSIFIADYLAQCGICVAKKIALSDELGAIQSALRASSSQADVVILTGGLGSTVDDRTREAVAAAFGRPLAVRSKAMRILKRQVEGRGRTVTPLLAKQALMPEGAIVLDNRVGTAPGFYVLEGKTHVFVLPGVPREARDMMDLQVQPILKRKLKSAVVLWSKSFNTVGLPETDIQQKISPFLQESSAIDLSLLASTKGVKVTLNCWRPKNQKSKRFKTANDFPEGDLLIQQVRETLEPGCFLKMKKPWRRSLGNYCLLTNGLLHWRNLVRGVSLPIA